MGNLPNKNELYTHNSIVKFARNAVTEFFGVELRDTVPVFLGPLEEVQKISGCEEAVACYVAFEDGRPRGILISGGSFYEICWQTVHEYGHMAQYELHESYTHEPAKFFYEYVYDVCESYIALDEAMEDPYEYGNPEGIPGEY
jgi:hypothetical protein